MFFFRTFVIQSVCRIVCEHQKINIWTRVCHFPHCNFVLFNFNSAGPVAWRTKYSFGFWHANQCKSNDGKSNNYNNSNIGSNGNSTSDLHGERVKKYISIDSRNNVKVIVSDRFHCDSVESVCQSEFPSQ